MSDIRLTGKMVSFSRLTLNTAEPTRIHHALTQLLGSDGANQGLPVLVDSTVDVALPDVLAQLKAQGLQIMGVVDGLLGDQARALGMTVLPADRPMQRIQPSEPAPVSTAATVATNAPVAQAVAAPAHTLLHHEVVRTGQRLVAEHGDVILTADMNSGSEIIAMGSVHVYGTIRGRVFAGAAGETNARIFCQRLDAELVSIAGTYCVSEDIPANLIGHAVHISINAQGELLFQPLQAMA
jgi:septum site-determining protein MinC